MIEIDELQIILSELDNIVLDDYFPFSEMHCIWEMRCGALRLFEKIMLYFPKNKVVFDARELQIKSLISKEDGIDNVINYNIPTLKFILPIVLNTEIKRKIVNYIKENSNMNIYFKSSDAVFAKYLPNYLLESKELEVKEKEELYINIDNVNIIRYLWDNLDLQSREIEQDIYMLKNTNVFHYTIEDNLYKGINVQLYPGVIIDTSKGSVILEDNVQIMHNSVIIGPCYIGKNTIIKVGSNIYENCSFGSYCKIGGEVADTIFHNYSNKQHSGFIGGSYIGEWVNLGADTNNSDLKNNYSKIAVNLPHKVIDTGKQFLGCMCGDYSKTAICTRINTGTIIGNCAMIAISRLTPKYIPSFSWLTEELENIYKIEKAIETAKIVLKRRNKIITNEEEKMLLSIFNKYKK